MKMKTANTEQESYSGSVIYGDDNRIEIKDHPSQNIRNYAKAVAVMVHSNDLRQDPDRAKFLKYIKTPAFAPFDLCRDDAYTKQDTLSHCSAFLVDEHTLITAGHCLNTQGYCDNVSFVFDYLKSGESLPKKNVYKCQKIIETGVNPLADQDYSVIKLERAVNDREALSYRTTGAIRAASPVIMIGSPFGVPLKVADQAFVTSTFSTIESILQEATQAGERDLTIKLKTSSYFMANLDSFAGNSGSPVINEKNGLVEGIISYGAEDWYYDEVNYCYRTVKKDKNSAVEELIYKITDIEYLKEKASPYRP
jgi:V8-like Glu-specific endopeptidase